MWLREVERTDPGDPAPSGRPTSSLCACADLAACPSLVRGGALGSPSQAPNTLGRVCCFLADTPEGSSLLAGLQSPASRPRPLQMLSLLLGLLAGTHTILVLVAEVSKEAFPAGRKWLPSALLGGGPLGEDVGRGFSPRNGAPSWEESGLPPAVLASLPPPQCLGDSCGHLVLMGSPFLDSVVPPSHSEGLGLGPQEPA